MSLVPHSPRRICNNRYSVSTNHRAQATTNDPKSKHTGHCYSFTPTPLQSFSVALASCPTLSRIISRSQLSPTMASLFEWAFGKKLTPQERLRKNQRALDKTQRELAREVTKLQQQEKKLMLEIKKLVKAGQVLLAKIQAKDLVRTKGYIVKFNQMKTQLQAISLRIQLVRLNQQMAMLMNDATRLLAGMNRLMNLPLLSRIAQEFAKENDMMDQKQEFMDDAIDDAMAMDDEELGEDEQVDEILGKVMDEIGVDLNTTLQDTPNSIAAGAQDQRQAVGVGASDEDDLQARLDLLKK